MPLLEKFTSEQQDFLASMPYRVGLFVSQSDSSGGEESEDAEARTLEIIVRGYAEDYCKNEFVETLMKATLARKDKWGGWGENLDAVPEQCGQAIDMVVNTLDKKMVAAFKNNLFEVGLTVAMAYREEPHGSFFSNLIDDFFLLVEQYKAMFFKREARHIDEILNVSKAEREALERLKEHLRLGQVEGIEPLTVNDVEDEVIDPWAVPEGVTDVVDVRKLPHNLPKEPEGSS
jgi:hypothetical protein